MRIAAILGVKDEAEILEDCIGHLRDIGVDLIIAHDAGCSDGSEAILARHEGPDFKVVLHSDEDPDAGAWNRLHARLARESGADWILFQDADEFWMPATGKLRDCRALAGSDLLSVPRYNVLLGVEGPLIDGATTPRGATGMQLVCQAPDRFRERLEADANLAWLLGVPVPKVIVRPSVVGHVADGGHAIEAPEGVSVRRAVPDDLYIAHLPFSTLSRFSQKLSNIRRVFEVHAEHFGVDLAWHWRRWLALSGEPAIAAEFARQVIAEETLAPLRSHGIVKSSQEIFASADARLAPADAV